MANIREIKTRMNSIEDTLKITNAMYLISSSKLKKARKQLDATTPYFEMLQASLLDIMAHTPDLQHIFLNKRKKEHPKKGYLVMTADRGLAGAYNHNITKMAEENINEDDKLFVIGYMGGFLLYNTGSYDLQSKKNCRKNDRGICIRRT